MGFVCVYRFIFASEMFRGSNPTKGFEPQQKGGITPVAAGDFARSVLANPFISAPQQNSKKFCDCIPARFVV